jgi:hypothetical protein
MHIAVRQPADDSQRDYRGTTNARNAHRGGRVKVVKEQFATLTPITMIKIAHRQKYTTHGPFPSRMMHRKPVDRDSMRNPPRRNDEHAGVLPISIAGQGGGNVREDINPVMIPLPA